MRNRVVSAAQRSSKSAEWYLPVEYVRDIRHILGSIDLDVASCAAANEVVKAKRYLCKANDARTTPWVEDGSSEAVNAIANPPGDRAGQNVKDWWQLALRWTTTRRIRLLWCGFSLNSFQTLQTLGPDVRHPAECLRFFPVKRPHWRPGGEARGRQGRLWGGVTEVGAATQPTQPAYFALLNGTLEQEQRFVARWAPKGRVFAPSERLVQ